MKPVTASLLLILLVGSYLPTRAQAPVTLDSCYLWAEAHYPMSRQRDLIERSRQYNVENLSKGLYPQLLVSGQATYQSDVTSINIPIDLPGFESTIIPRDQYRFAGEVTQTLTDFPLNKAQRDLKSLEAGIQQQQLNAELYKLRERVNQLYFGVLLLDEQLVLSGLLKKDIQRGIDQTKAALENGTAYRSSLDKLNAELLKVQQHDIELKAGRTAYLNMLAQLTGQTLDRFVRLERPGSPVYEDSIRRPELQTFAAQQRASELQTKLLGLKNIPRLQFFFQGGVGSPNPVNFFEGDFQPFYITGLRLNWSPGVLYSYKKEKALTENDRQNLDLLRETFLLNTTLTMTQQRTEIDKYQELTETDEVIIFLRESVKNTAFVQLENGVITTNDYLKEVNEADQARQNKALHEIQLLMARYARKTTAGN